tara:strand:- start:2637 stop:3089 length:453 start_codon:yes stop_codon:yes gene_type:complete
MATFPVAPTYADVVLVDSLTGKGIFNPIWLRWFLDLASFLTESGGGSGGADHALLSSLQGGGTSEYYHLTNAEHSALTAGFTGTTSLVRSSSPTITTPIISDAVLHRSVVTLTNGAAAAAATLLNAPAAGNPTKWAPVNDNGTTRYVPLW